MMYNKHTGSKANVMCVCVRNACLLVQKNGHDTIYPELSTSLSILSRPQQV